MTPTAAPARRNLLRDILIVMGRELRPVTSDPFSLVVGLIQPLFFLLLFGPLVAANSNSVQDSPWAWFVPLVLQALVIILVMIPFGFRPDPAGALLGLIFLGILGIGIGSLSYALAIAVREADWMFWTIHQTLLFPLMILSGMLLPLDDGPQWMRILAQANPLTHVVNAERDLFAGQLATAVLGITVGVRALKASTR